MEYAGAAHRDAFALRRGGNRTRSGRQLRVMLTKDETIWDGKLA